MSKFDKKQTKILKKLQLSILLYLDLTPIFWRANRHEGRYRCLQNTVQRHEGCLPNKTDNKTGNHSGHESFPLR